MTNLLEEVNEYFDFLYRSKKINFYEFNSYEFCELKLIKDMDEKFHQKGDILDSFFVKNLVMLYLYLSEAIHLNFNVMDRNTKRAGIELIIEHLSPRLDFCTFVEGSIKSMSEGTNLDSECLRVFGLSEKDIEEYLAREGIKEIDTINSEEDRKKIINFLRLEDNDLSVCSKQYKK